MSRLSEAKTELERYEQTKPAAYQSQYQQKINDVTGKLEGLGEFDYDPDADTAYKQYKESVQPQRPEGEPERAGQCGGADRRVCQQLRHAGGAERL